MSLIVSASPTQPDWSAKELRTLLSQAQSAAHTPTLEAQNQVLLVMASSAYRVRSGVGGDIQSNAKTVLRRRVPEHPNVKKGQWLDALIRQFYDDVSKRSAILARFSRERSERVFFEQMAQQARAASDQLAQNLQLEVEGLEGFFAPLAIVDGVKPYPHAARATVGPDGSIDVEGMKRVQFVGHQPPPNADRTGKGALRRLFSAFQFFERSARSLGAFDDKWAKKRGHIRAIVPARFPAIYLNEIARAAREAKLCRLHVMVMTKRGELRELRVDLKKPKSKKRRAKSVDVTCADAITMTRCAERIAYAQKKGRPVWATP